MPTPNITVAAGNMNSGTENSLMHVRDVDTKLFYLDSQKYPLVSSLFTAGTELERNQNGDYVLKGSNAMKKMKTTQPKFEHTESERLKFAFNPTAAVAAADASITITTDDDDYFVAGHEILLVNANGDREVARVTAVGSGSLTVTRNIGSTGAIALTTADFFYLLGVVRAEDSQSTDARQAKSETLYNYVEFLSEPYGVSDIEQASANYHGSPIERKKMEAWDRMRQKLELMFWFGVRDVTSSTTNPVYHNGGIMYWLESQFTDVTVYDVGGLLTKQVWDQFLADVLKYGNRDKVAFCSSIVLTAINGFAMNQLRPADVNLKKFGMAILEYQSPFGTVKLVHEPLFDDVTSMNGGAVVVDMSRIRWRFLEGNGVNLDLKSYDMIQENDRSARKGEWKTVGGIDVMNGKAHGILKNVVA